MELDLRSRIKKEVNKNLDHEHCIRSILCFYLLIHPILLVSCKQMLEALRVAEKTEKPNLKNMFSDVYDVPPTNLREQEHLVRQTIKSHPQDYPSDVPL